MHGDRPKKKGFNIGDKLFGGEIFCNIAKTYAIRRQVSIKKVNTIAV